MLSMHFRNFKVLIGENGSWKNIAYGTGNSDGYTQTRSQYSRIPSNFSRQTEM